MTTLVAPTLGRQLGIPGDDPGGPGWETYAGHRAQDYFWLSRDPATSQQIYATHEGRVEIVSADGSYNGGWGNLIRVHHPSGRFYTAYAHIRNGGFAVSDGQYVSPGQLIAHMGDTGLARGVHLHFELWIDGVRVNDAFQIEHYFFNDLPGTDAPGPNPPAPGLVRKFNPAPGQAILRQYPNTGSDIVGDPIEPNSYGDFRAYIHGESVDGNDIWLLGAYSDRWAWAGSFTDPTPETLPLYGAEPSPPPPAPELYTSPEPWGEGLIALSERVGVPYATIQALNPWVGAREGGWDVVYPSDQIRYQ